MALFIRMGLALLHVLTQRGVRIYGKHQHGNATVASHGNSLVPAAEAFDAAFSAVRDKRMAKDEVLAKARASIERLFEAARVWAGRLLLDVPGLDLEVELDPESPDRVLRHAEGLIEVAEQRKDALAYAPALVEQVGPLLAAASADWTAAQEALGELQELQRVLRERSVVMNRELVAFRRTLRNVLGTSHRDYQLLRVRRAVPEVEADVAPEQPVAEPIAPSNGATVTTPRAQSRADPTRV